MSTCCIAGVLTNTYQLGGQMWRGTLCTGELRASAALNRLVSGFLVKRYVPRSLLLCDVCWGTKYAGVSGASVSARKLTCRQRGARHGTSVAAEGICLDCSM